MKLVFIGADHEVTGSCHYLEVGDKHILVDYGMACWARRCNFNPRSPCGERQQKCTKNLRIFVKTYKFRRLFGNSRPDRNERPGRSPSFRRQKPVRTHREKHGHLGFAFRE